ncbi:hypothetical protein E2C01_017773 [Portunus trituberculatus]|uniref:Uncharacterized protein n=1 Tax=Portunus trituberculatus TaxID=210409 RepID=A0A5B7DTS5_PORTR|nr:hypothetical protein [Portunus trituberculatus]
MLELVRKREHFWDSNNEFHKNLPLRKSTFDEIAATHQEQFPSMQGVVGGEDWILVRL